MTVDNAIAKLKKNGFMIQVSEHNPNIIFARKENSETITLFRNGGCNNHEVAVIEVGRDNTFASSIAMAIRLAAVVYRAPASTSAPMSV